jgi:hypothetical protein
MPTIPVSFSGRNAYTLGLTGFEVEYPDLSLLAPNRDGFYRDRVSEPKTIFDSKQITNNQSLFWSDEEVSGSGTTSVFNTNQASTTLKVSDGIAGKRVRQTRRWFNYQPGKSQLVILTGVLNSPQNGISKRLGLFNNENGLFFECKDGVFSVCVRTSTSGTPVDIKIPQSQWNIDKLDGTGKSGITLDFTKTQIFFFDFEWLGVGTKRYGFFVDGKPFYCHYQNNANINTVVYMSTPNLPVRYEIENDGSGGADELVHICTTVVTEGGRDDTVIPRTIPRDVDPLITLNDASLYPLIGMRLKSTDFGSYTKIVDFTAICTSASTYFSYLTTNPTIVGTAPTWLPLDNSGVEYCLPTNATTLTGGTSIYSTPATDTNQITTGVNQNLNSDFSIGSSVSGVPDTLFLAIRRVIGTTETFYGALNLIETQ